MILLTVIQEYFLSLEIWISFLLCSFTKKPHYFLSWTRLRFMLCVIECKDWKYQEINRLNISSQAKMCYTVRGEGWCVKEGTLYYCCYYIHCMLLRGHVLDARCKRQIQLQIQALQFNLFIIFSISWHIYFQFTHGLNAIPAYHLFEHSAKIRNVQSVLIVIVQHILFVIRMMMAVLMYISDDCVLEDIWKLPSLLIYCISLLLSGEKRVMLSESKRSIACGYLKTRTNSWDLNSFCSSY